MFFQRERVHDVIPEMPKLLQSHWAEVARDHDIPLEPDYEIYRLMEDKGSLRMYTAREIEGGKLIGYNCFFVQPHLHYKSSIQASQDIIFIDKERRGFGRRFINWCDEQLADEGVQKVMHHVKAKHNFGPLLESLGYELADLIYAKRLDKEV